MLISLCSVWGKKSLKLVPLFYVNGKKNLGILKIRTLLLRSLPYIDGGQQAFSMLKLLYHTFCLIFYFFLNLFIYIYILVSKNIFYCKETTSCTRETKNSKDFIILLHFYIHTGPVWLDLLYLFSLNFEKPF